MLWYKIQRYVIDKLSRLQMFKYPMFFIWGDIHYQIKGPDQRQILNVLQPGDLLLRRYERYVTGRATPGYYTHVAVYVGDNTILHMLGKGCIKEDILTFMRCDNICILRSHNRHLAPTAIKRAWEIYYEGKEYDYAFDFKDDSRMSCTEYCSTIYGHPNMEHLKEGYIVPDDFLRSIFYVVWRKK